MRSIEDSLYAQWRLRCGVVTVLREDEDYPPERLLQAVWQHQRLRRDHLMTLEGQMVQILHPGFLSVEGGPDFRSAVVRVGAGPVQTGDVEVDLRSSGWRAHGHDRNPAFEKVILHVIWEGEKRLSGEPPAMALRRVLDSSLGELSQWLGGEADKPLPSDVQGKCAPILKELGDDQRADLLRQAAGVRLRSKAAWFSARARQGGWEGALWDGIFRALGYKHNVWPMLRLAELRPRWMKGHTGSLSLQARLLGISGLLPEELTRSRATTDAYLLRVWDTWWREREVFSDCLLPRTLWRMHGLRPANHPQRRLALASHWLAEGKLVKRLEQWAAKDLSAEEREPSLFKILDVPEDDYWNWSWTFQSTRLKKPQPLLGESRATDLAVNVILPWLWSRAHEGKNNAMRDEIEKRYFAWPPAQDNSLLRLARQRLFGGALRRQAGQGAAMQQGVLQILRDFCDHSNSVCDGCLFPRELIKAYGVPPSGGQMDACEPTPELATKPGAWDALGPVMSVIVKICGITRLADALAAAEAGADALGFMFYERSSRCVSISAAAEMIAKLPPRILKVGVFVDPSREFVLKAVQKCGLNLLQFHGHEAPDFCMGFGIKCMKAFPIRDADSLGAVKNYPTDAWLLDAYSPGKLGGTGERFNWEFAIQARQMGRPIFLAGGLTPENVAEAVRTVRPYGVDVSSGVEASPGLKDPAKIRMFVREAKEAGGGRL